MNFSQSLRGFVRSCVPNLDAVELLLRLAEAPRQSFGLEELVARVHAPDMTKAAARRYLEQFETCGVVAKRRARYRYAPADDRRRRLVQALRELYNQRPVTLVRMIYSERDASLRAFSDAFRLKKD